MAMTSIRRADFSFAGTGACRHWVAGAPRDTKNKSGQ